jgi:tetratricopeptide (TPR) repeat protein
MGDSDEARLRDADGAGDAGAARQLGILLQDRGDLDGAEAAYQRAGERGDLTALAKLAILIDIHREDPVAAEAAYRRADEAGSVDGAGNIGRILKERGDLRGAEAAFRRCVERGSVRALADYAGLLSQRGDASAGEIIEAVQWMCRVEDRSNGNSESPPLDPVEAAAPLMVFSGMWERCDPEAMEAGVRAADADGSAAGAYRLGIELRGRGELQGAAEASRRAAKRGYPLGWVDCGVALLELGDLDGAEAAARIAEQEDEPAGATLMGSILEQRGDPAGAFEALRRADAAGDGNGSFNLGVDLMNQGQDAEAEAAFARAEERGAENAAAARNQVRRRLGLTPVGAAARSAGESAWEVGARLERLGDLPGSVAAFVEAMDAGEEPTDPLAVLRQAELLEGQNDPAAEAAFQRIAEATDPAIRAAAWRGISRYRIDRGETEAALEALRSVIGTGDPDETPRALRNLGVLREDLGDFEGARAAYREAIGHDHPLHSQGARVNLAQLLDTEGDHAAAAQLFREVVDSGHPAEAPRARVLLGQMLLEQGDVTQALQWFESAIVDEDSEWSQRAALDAGGIYLMQLRDLDKAVEAFRIAERIEEVQESLTASNLLAQAEGERGNEHEALVAYTRVVEGDGARGGALRFSAAKQAGIIRLRREDFEKARGLLVLAASTEDPAEKARGLLLLGSCERSSGNRDAASTAFQQAASIPGAPEDVRGLAHQALSELR